MTLDIGDVSRRSGLPPSTLRYYEEKGLISSTGRRGLRRLFDQSILQRLALITLGREAGFSLEEIASMFTPTGKLSIDRKKCLEKADELEHLAKRLVSVSNVLRHTAACRAPSHLECPSFQRYVKVAEKKSHSMAKRK
ncbi:MAG: helix-turn-helix domain-containing protein [Acidiferrobacterales bacterium]|nr:helix-turn-helix domain-containing protein [Acidiferrobacterales bacterium]